MPPKVTVNGETVAVDSVDELRRHFDRMCETQFSEVWIMFGRGPCLCALANGDNAWLMYQREAGESGLRSYNPAYAGSDDDLMEFRLGNGQRDEYPARW